MVEKAFSKFTSLRKRQTGLLDGSLLCCSGDLPNGCTLYVVFLNGQIFVGRDPWYRLRRT